MATKSTNPIPQGMHSITPQMVYNGNCMQAIEYYKKAFGAKVLGEIAMSPGGNSVWHALIQIGNSAIMMNDVMPGSYEVAPSGSTTVGLWLYVEDCDAVMDQAAKNGAEVTMPAADMFWGDRMGKLTDPFGHSWDIATHTWDYTPEEIQQKQEEFLASMKG